MGVILRDCIGTVLLEASMEEPEVGDPVEIELVAMLRGLQLCLPMGIEEIILASESLLIVISQIRKEIEP